MIGFPLKTIFLKCQYRDMTWPISKVTTFFQDVFSVFEETTFMSGWHCFLISHSYYNFKVLKIFSYFYKLL